MEAGKGRERSSIHLKKMSRNKEYVLPWRQGGTFTGGAFFPAPSHAPGTAEKG